MARSKTKSTATSSIGRHSRSAAQPPVKTKAEEPCTAYEFIITSKFRVRSRKHMTAHSRDFQLLNPNVVRKMFREKVQEGIATMVTDVVRYPDHILSDENIIDITVTNGEMAPLEGIGHIYRRRGT